MRQSVTSALAAVRKLMYECPGNANYYRFFANSVNNRSAGGQDEQPCEVNSSTTIGRAGSDRKSVV